MSVNIESRSRRSSQHLLITAGAALAVLGTIHLLLLTAIRHDVTAGWFGDGGWSVVPFFDATPTVESLDSSVVFWSGIGGFPVPMVLLGVLLVHLGRNGVAVPSWLGWAVGLWGLVAGILLGPTPYLVLPLVGASIVVAGRMARPRPAERP